jgi:hypothetical protein
LGRPCYRKEKLAFALGRAPSSSSNLSVAVDALSEACHAAAEDILQLVAGMSRADCEAATAYALGGGRGYGGKYHEHSVWILS